MHERAAHNELCSSPGWAEYLEHEVLPAVLGGVELGERLIEIGPGFGLAANVLRLMVDQVTVVDVDPTLAAGLGERLAGTNVTIVLADGTDLPFEAGRFSSAASFTMLHHVPTQARQDRLLVEVARVLKPGGVVGSDSLNDRDFREFHAGDVYVPVDPEDLPDRLRCAGFADAHVTVAEGILRFVARAPSAGRPHEDRPL